jgi:hypothetical protein
MTRAIVLVMTAMLASTCTRQPNPPPALLDAGQPDCQFVCAHFESLGCSEADSAHYGARCLGVCNAVANDPQIGAWPLDCFARAQTCEGIHACEAGK